MKTKKINLYGGPGIGKSTVANLLYATLKIKGINVESVSEYAKELVYEGFDLRKADQNFQTRILIEQLRRELLFKDKVEYLISDSPLMLNAFYNGKPAAVDFAKDNESPQDVHFYLIRTNEHFEGVGRSHNESESTLIDKQMLSFLNKNGITPSIIDGNSHEKVAKILEILGLT